MSKEKIIAPSILSANFGRLKEEIQMLDESDAQWVHLDVMDGLFVPNISFGFPVISEVRKHTKKPLDAHLMIVDPDRYLERFAGVGVDYLTVHYEACTHLQRTLTRIRELGMKPGIAINPHTLPELLQDALPFADLVLIMSVNPGFGGQKFIHTSIDRIARLKVLAQKHNPQLLIEVDGGVNLENASQLWEAGANVLVAGNTVFASEKPKETIGKLINS